MSLVLNFWLGLCRIFHTFFHLPVVWRSFSRITIALPLSAGRILMMLSLFNSCSAFLSSREMFDVSGLVLLTIIVTSRPYVTINHQ